MLNYARPHPPSGSKTNLKLGTTLWGMSSYYSYDMNLVFEDSSRINIIDHGNKKILR